MTPQRDARGVLAAWLAYGIWGLFPLYFHALRPAGATEILAHRVIWTFVLCVVVLLLRTELVALLRQLRGRLALGVGIAAYLIGINWFVYVYAVGIGQTNEAALGYFLNPIVTVGLGVLVLGERLRALQWVAVAIGALAAVYLTVAGGGLPWISLVLAMSFGGYGLTKKKLGATLPALQSLSAETIFLLPPALGLVWWLTARGDSTFTTDAPWHPLLLVSAGVITAIPLLLFAEAARRIPLVTIGLIQFITPVIQLVVSVTLLGEHVDPARWLGFAIVWVALVCLTVDSLRTARQRRRPAPDECASLEPVEPV
ncbi:EamA family transporter RarD [Janibacter limosus]|uniref:EamA family transporter RarD n=1 Tax=Janibacter limosus TaxID=53458 RepID=A0A4V0ZB74_9MICO|nr:EamA family transporter RarD [Janibacter limosus]QBF47008.1 EamA family transporter RarD [Janibacter limosus]